MQNLERTPRLIPQILRFGRKFRSRKTTRRSSLQNRKKRKKGVIECNVVGEKLKKGCN